MKNIIAFSGGESSACIAIMLKEVPGIILYFNDTKWEHPDLYRYITEIKEYTNLPLINDSLGMNQEEIAYKSRFLPNNRVPLCSRILKAEMLQKYASQGDCIYFGIGTHEIHRAARIRAIYSPLGIDTVFPLIDNKMDNIMVTKYMETIPIKRPMMYALGFEHNNCNGGCVRQGARQWRHLLKVFPDIYKERERFEIEFSEKIKKSTFLKDISLTRLREIEESQIDLFDDNSWNGECIGICGSMI